MLIEKLEQLEDGDVRKIGLDQVDSWSINTNLNVVCLYFEAFYPDQKAEDLGADEHKGKARSRNSRRRICDPVVSYPVQHNSK